MKQGLKKSGFTLIELLVVMAIILILASIIVPKIGDARGKANRVSCASNMRSIVKAMQLYEEDRGVSVVSNKDNDTTLQIFGRLNYKDGDQMGITTMKLYNCPETKSTPPTATAYKVDLTLAAPQNIDYGLVLTENTLFKYKEALDHNIVLAEIVENHSGGRNLAFWDSRVSYFPKKDTITNTKASYPKNSVALTGSTSLANIYDTVQIINNTTTRAQLSIT